MARSAVLLGLVLLSFLACAAHAQLSANFYSTSCPSLQSIVRSAMTQAVNREARIGASILRLFFHDCFVNGCDASILLDDTATFTGEKTALPNLNSARGFDVIDTIKSRVEAACNRTVSCADILALAARDGVVLLGGPSWTVQLGRRDATTASFSAANGGNIPPPNSNLAALIAAFANKGLSARDLVVLYGAHTIGQARCASFRTRIYNDPSIDPSYAASLRAICPTSGGDDNLAPLDFLTPTRFDTNYYQNLRNGRGLLRSDQELLSGGSMDAIVQTYSSDGATFFREFAAAMVRMGAISSLTGTSGEIRGDCRRVN